MVGSGTGGGVDANHVGNPAAGAQCAVREQDRFMPIANVIRIMRKVLPTHAKISDDAKETIQECVSEYISFITSEANERCQRKTITAEDVLWAMSKLGFDDYIEPLSLYLQRYRELEGDHRGSIRGEPLPVIRHRSPNNPSSTDVVVSAPPLFAQPPPPPSFVVPPASGPPHLNHLYGDGAGGGYYYGMYGGGGGDGSGASTSQDPPMPAFDHPYVPYK